MTQPFKDIEEMEQRGFDEATITEAVEYNKTWQYFFNSELGNYLNNKIPTEVQEASGGRLLPIEAIIEEISEGACPGHILFEYNILPIWTSIGGNALCYHPKTKAFYWADHSRISDDYVQTPDYEELPISEENLFKSLIKISDTDCNNFIENLIAGKYEDELDELD